MEGACLQDIEVVSGDTVLPCAFQRVDVSDLYVPRKRFQADGMAYGRSRTGPHHGGAWLFRRLVPEKDLRLELYFILNALTAVFGVVATVNGQTSAEGYSEVDWKASAGLAAIILAGAVAGLAWYAFRLLRNRD